MPSISFPRHKDIEDSAEQPFDGKLGPLESGFCVLSLGAKFRKTRSRIYQGEMRRAWRRQERDERVKIAKNKRIDHGFSAACRTQTNVAPAHAS